MVELLVAMAVATIVLTLMYQVYVAQLKSHTTQQEVVEMQQNMRAALYLMEREIRLAGFNPTGKAPAATVGVTDITTAVAESITFSMDYSEDGTDGVDNDKDGITDENPEPDGEPDEKITYNLSANGELQRTVGVDPPGIIARGIDVVEFALLDEDGNTTTDPGEIRSVRIQLDASLPATPMIKGDGKDMSIVSEVKCRNLGIN